MEGRASPCPALSCLPFRALSGVQRVGKMPLEQRKLGKKEISPQKEIDKANAGFWSELCGSAQAKALGMSGNDLRSLEKFDNWFFKFYPYLHENLKIDDVAGKRVLEVGLGYGSVSQCLVEHGANFTGLDIALGPVAAVNHRLGQQGFPGVAVQGSILQAPFDDSSFDAIISIGCFHHTGDIQRAINEAFRLLVPGGRLSLMVYNAYSYRRFHEAFHPTMRYMLWDYIGIGHRPNVSELERRTYDSDTNGRVAPHTEFISRRHLSMMCVRFRTFSASLENIDQEGIFRRIPRERLLSTIWPKIAGLDIYATAVK